MNFYNTTDFNYGVLHSYSLQRISMNISDIKVSYPYILTFKCIIDRNLEDDIVYYNNESISFFHEINCLIFCSLEKLHHIFLYIGDKKFIEKDILDSTYERNIIVFMKDKKLYSKIKLSEGNII